jgi:hypothetical protein
VRGTAESNPLDYPTIPELAEAPPAASQAVIPTREWKEAFKSVPRGRGAEAIMQNVAVHLGADESVLATTDGENVNVVQARNVEARFPDYQSVIPKKAPQAKVMLNPTLLLDLVKLAQGFTDPNAPYVSLEIHGPDQPITLRAASGAQEFVALLMPLSEA